MQKLRVIEKVRYTNISKKTQICADNYCRLYVNFKTVTILFTEFRASYIAQTT